MTKRILSLTVLLSFILTSLGPLPKAHAANVNLPAPGTMVNLSPAYEPVMIKGLTVHKDNPFLFDFIVDIGQDKMSGAPLKTEGEKLIKYFLASLAIPEKDLWVNLSPYEKDKTVPEALGQTDMGRDLLAQDYILKQITASLIYPEKELGKKFWDRVYAKAQQMYGTTEVPVNTFNKVWIMADRAEVFERNQTAFVVDQHLKVMLEEDYLALDKNQTPTRGHVQNRTTKNVSPGTLPSEIGLNAKAPQGNPPATSTIGSQIIREIILPELEREVNQGKNFANLRQIFNSIILSSWYKKNLKQALLNQVYADQSKVKGIDLNDPTVKEQIYQQYLKAYKKGVFNYIKEDVVNGVIASPEGAKQSQTVPRKYFSGGVLGAGAAASPAMTHDPVKLGNALSDRALVSFETGFNTVQDLKSQAPAASAASSAPRVEIASDSAMTALIEPKKSGSLRFSKVESVLVHTGAFFDMVQLDIVRVKKNFWQLSFRKTSRESPVIFDITSRKRKPLSFYIQKNAITLEHSAAGEFIELEFKVVDDMILMEIKNNTKDSTVMVHSDYAMMAEVLQGLLTYQNVLGVHYVGLSALAAAIVKSHYELVKGRNAKTIDEKIMYYKRFNKDILHIIGAMTILFSGLGLGGMVGLNIDVAPWLAGLIGVTGSMIGGGIAGFETFAKDLLQAAEDARANGNGINDPKLKAIETFKGNPARRAFYYSQGPVFIALWVLASKKPLPSFWPTDALHHFVQYMPSAYHLDYILPMVATGLVGAGVGVGLSLAFANKTPKVGKEDAAMTVVDVNTLGIKVNGNEYTKAFIKRYRYFLKQLIDKIEIIKNTNDFIRDLAIHYEDFDNGKVMRTVYIHTHLDLESFTPEQLKDIAAELSTRTYKVVISQGDDGWWASLSIQIPSLRKNESETSYNTRFLGVIERLRGKLKSSVNVIDEKFDRYGNPKISISPASAAMTATSIHEFPLISNADNLVNAIAAIPYQPEQLARFILDIGAVGGAISKEFRVEAAPGEMSEVDLDGKKFLEIEGSANNPEVSREVIEEILRDSKIWVVTLIPKYGFYNSSRYIILGKAKPILVIPDAAMNTVPTATSKSQGVTDRDVNVIYEYFARQKHRWTYAADLLFSGFESNEAVYDQARRNTSNPENVSLSQIGIGYISNAGLDHSPFVVFDKMQFREFILRAAQRNFNVVQKYIAMGIRESIVTTGHEAKPVADMKTEKWNQGGIDLNTAGGMQWKVSRDGLGVEMNVDPAMVARIQREGINWLSPVILRITPVASIWPLVGLIGPNKDGRLASV